MMPFSNSRRAATTWTIGTASPSAQGQVMISTAMAIVMARCQSPDDGHPAEERQQGGQMDDRRIERRCTVGDAAVARAAALGRFHQPQHLGEEGIRWRAAVASIVSGAGQVERAGAKHRCRVRPAAARSRRSPASNRDRMRRAITRASTGMRSPAAMSSCIPGSISPTGRYSREPSVRSTMAPRGARLRQAAHGGARAVAHDMVERAPDQQEEQQRDGGVEIGMMRHD